MKHTLIAHYDSRAYTHNYIFGVSYKDKVYAVRATNEILPYIITLDKASRGQGACIKFRPTNAMKIMLIAMGAHVVCSAEYFEKLVANSKYNRGEIFEKLITEAAGQEWHKDNIPYTVAGDIEIDGIAYQIKYERATFLTEAQMVRG